MKKRLKQTVSMLVIIIMLVSLFPGGAWAEEGMPGSIGKNWNQEIVSTLTAKLGQEKTNPLPEMAADPLDLTAERKQPVTEGENIQTTVIEGDYEYVVVEGSVTITKYNGAGGDVTIPGTLGGLPVNKIGNYAFYNPNNLMSISLPEGLISIGDCAFGFCGRLASISLPESLTSIGDHAFYYCTFLTSISLSEGLTSIGAGVFAGCYSLTSITVAADNANYESVGGALYNKTKTALIAWPGRVTSISLPESLTSIGDDAFSGCRKLTSISLPESLTSIGDYAFCGCSSLTSISLPESVISIGNGAFKGCSSLTSISLPESVTSISNWAFEDCNSLASISLPKSLTSISGSAFRSCSSLMSISLPESLTSIGNGAFSGCRKLTSISLPKSLTSIDGAAFYECSSLISVSLPESVTSIGYCAFYGCNSLTSISLPESVTSIGNGAFSGCNSLKSIQFNSENTIIDYSYGEIIPLATTIIGYDPSTAKDYATQYGNPFQLIGESPNDVSTITVSPSAMVIKVKDIDTKSGMAGVSVTLAGKKVTTDSNGLATYENPVTGDQSLLMTCPGYCDYESSLQVKLGGAGVIYMQKDTGSDKPYLTMVNLNDGKMTMDVRRTEKVFVGASNESDLTEFDFATIEMKSNLRGKKLKKYILSQNGKTVMESTTGKFEKTALAEKFKDGYPIYAMVETQDGVCSDSVETKIKILSPSFKWGTGGGSGELHLGKKLGASIPGSLPVLGGTEIDFGMDVIPATITVTPDSFKIAVGVADMKDSVETWSSFRKTIEDAKSTSKASRMKDFKKLFKPKKIGLPITTGWEPEVDVMGYIEGTIVDGQPVVTKSTLILNAGASYSQQTQYIIGPVPVYLEVGGGLNMELMGEIARIAPESGELKLNTELTVTPSFELGGGVGVANVVTVGASGKAELDFLTRYTDDYQKLSLTGSMSLKAKALLFEAKKEIARGTWTIAEGYGNLGTAATESDPGMGTFSIYDASQYSLMPRDYAQNPTVWGGEQPLMSAQSVDYTNQTLSVLQTNLFPNAQPKLATIGDQQVMVWIADNTGRTSTNRTMLVYSVYNPTTKAWSELVAVADDSTADFYPQIASDGTSLYVAWQNSKTIFSDAVTLTEAAKAGEINLAKYDPAKQAFDAPTTLTNNDTLDTQPQLAVSGEKAGVVWTTNSANDLFGTTGRNAIQYAELNGTAWTPAQDLVSDQNAITGLGAGYTGSTLSAAFTVDGDNDLNTITDRDLFAAKPGQNATRLTNDDTLDSNPVFAGMNGSDSLFWYHDGNIVYTPAADFSATPGTVFAETRQGFGDTFSIVNNPAGKTAAIWTETKDEMTEIHGAIYDSAENQWSDDIQISNIGSRVQFPNGIFDDSGNFNIAFNRLTIREDLTEQSDLCVVNVVPAYNLTLDNVSYSDDAIIPNTALPIEVDVTNNGQLTVDQITVDVSDGEAGNSSITLSESIKPGETKPLSATINLPETITKKEYTVSIKTTAGDEYNVSDNTRSITLGYTDLALAIEKNNIGATNSLTVQVSNISYVPTNATVKVTEDTIDGTVLFTKELTNAGHGVNTFSIFELDPKTMSFSNGIKQIYVSVTASSEETSIGDNSDFIVLDNPVQPATLQSIAITTPATNLNYKIGEQLDLTGLVVTGTYSDATTKAETITADNVTGFDSSKVTADQVLTITVNGKTATYKVQIANNILLGDVDGNAKVQAFDALMALQIATGKKVGTAAEIKAADVGKSGKVEAYDALRILQYATGKITAF